MKNIEELKEQIQREKKFEYLFFWGDRQKRDGVIDKSCFSQRFGGLGCLGTMNMLLIL